MKAKKIIAALAATAVLLAGCSKKGGESPLTAPKNTDSGGGNAAADGESPHNAPNGSSADSSETGEATETSPDETNADESTPEESNPKIAIGSIIQFGGYNWIVLDLKSNNALIIMERATKEECYAFSAGTVSWEDSNLRKYLNSEFYNGFSGEDRKRVVKSKVANGGEVEDDTADYIFALSAEEAEQYFPDDESRIACNAFGDAAWWWLRSAGENGDNYGGAAAGVNSDGSIDFGGLEYARLGNVRPAMWLRL